MIKRSMKLEDFISLLKVFDVNYVTDDDYVKLHGLSGNKSSDVERAVNLLLLPELVTYSDESRSRLVGLLRSAVADPSEDFGFVFDRIELAFEDEVLDKRAFMSALLHGIEVGSLST